MSQLAKVQHDPSDINEFKSKKPHEWYNLYIRREGEPVLTEKQYADRVKLIKNKTIDNDK